MKKESEKDRITKQIRRDKELRAMSNKDRRHMCHVNLEHGNPYHCSINGQKYNGSDDNGKRYPDCEECPLMV